MYAFEVPIFRVVVPRGLKQETYDIYAALPKGSSIGDVPAMMRTLLAERLHLQSHFESRMENVYVLSLVGSGRLKPAEVDESQFIHGDFVKGTIEFRRATMAQVADQLTSCCSSRPVVDETNSTQEFDLTLAPGRDGFKLLPAPPREGEPPHEYDEGAWRSALKEHGLEAKRAQRGVRYLVIDSVDLIPTEN